MYVIHCVPILLTRLLRSSCYKVFQSFFGVFDNCWPILTTCGSAATHLPNTNYTFLKGIKYGGCQSFWCSRILSSHKIKSAQNTPLENTFMGKDYSGTINLNGEWTMLNDLEVNTPLQHCAAKHLHLQNNNGQQRSSVHYEFSSHNSPALEEHCRACVDIHADSTIH